VKLDDPVLDLKNLSANSCMSVRTLRDALVDPLRPLPHYKRGGKIFVRWSEFNKWLEGFRVDTRGLKKTVDEIVQRASAR
jgi:hypothetical protein